MEKLLDGVVHFKKKDFEDHKELFAELKETQKPHTLFIGCADSRVVPAMLTKSLPGDLFIIRNVANMVPPYRVADEYLSTTAAIEYAISVLDIETILICGHSNCGGCALLHKEKSEIDQIPNVRKWMELAAPVKKAVDSALPQGKDAEKAWLTEQINILEQMKHLLTYPRIMERYKAGKLNILGWHYIIDTGEVLQYNKEKEVFELIN